VPCERVEISTKFTSERLSDFRASSLNYEIKISFKRIGSRSTKVFRPIITLFIF
jgi:hypothetical protein